MPFVYIIIVFIAIIIIANIKVVRQNTVLVIEMLGKYNRVMAAGLNVKFPLLERVAKVVTMRQQNFVVAGKYPSADKVIVDVNTNLIYAVNPTEDGIQRFTYALQDASTSIGATVENSLRTYIAKETHEGILEKKE